MKTILLLTLALATLNGLAQTDSSTTTPEWNFKDSKKIIKITPGDILSRTSMLGADLEFTYQDDISFQLGAALLPSYLQTTVGSEEGDYDRLAGYNLRGESRFYILKKPNHYLAAGIEFRHLIIKSNVPVGMEATQPNPQQQDFAYFVNTQMRFHRFNSDLTAKWGFQRTFATDFVFDFYAGLGLKNVSVQSFSKIPEGGIVSNNWSTEFTLVDNFKKSNIRPTVGFKLGYILKNK